MDPVFLGFLKQCLKPSSPWMTGESFVLIRRSIGRIDVKKPAALGEHIETSKNYVGKIGHLRGSGCSEGV